MRFKKDPDLDARIVFERMRGMVEPFLIGIGMTPNDCHLRGEWLNKQSKQYQHAVISRVKVLEKNAIRDKLI